MLQPTIKPDVDSPGARGLGKPRRATKSRSGWKRTVWITALIVTGLFFILAGLNHFRSAALYAKIIPPGFPFPYALVIISGIAEIAGGIGLLIPFLRRAAGWGLIALLISVFPANIYMALKPDAVPGVHIAPWLLWLRLPLQFVLMAWVWWLADLRWPHWGKR